MKTLLCILLSLKAILCLAQNDRPEVYCKHFFYGYPFGTPKTNDLIIRDIYALSNNETTKFADWVAYRLTMHEVDGDLTVERNWKADPWLDPSETLEPSPNKADDYNSANKGLKTDRGHQVPLAAFKGSRHASHTNFYSNITPQKSALNQGVWKHLEDKVRDLVRDVGEVYVMSGPVYERDMPSLPKADEDHKVPSGYWKIICIEENDFINVAAFFFDQDTPRKNKILNHQESIDFIEQKTGLDFLWLLDDGKENDLESQKNKVFAEKYFTQ